MTSPNQPDDDRFSQLVDIVLSSTGTEIPASLSEVERREVERLSMLFTAIDAAWQTPEIERKRVHALFLQKLGAKYPGHPWVQTDTVRTLGELLRLDRDEAPALPAETLARLERDPTPVEILLDPVKRSAAVGRAVQQAALPTGLITAFMRWLNQAIAQITPEADSEAQGFSFTRRQLRKRQQQSSEQD